MLSRKLVWLLGFFALNAIAPMGEAEILAEQEVRAEAEGFMRRVLCLRGFRVQPAL